MSIVMQLRELIDETLQDTGKLPDALYVTVEEMEWLHEYYDSPNGKKANEAGGEEFFSGIKLQVVGRL